MPTRGQAFRSELALSARTYRFNNQARSVCNKGNKSMTGRVSGRCRKTRGGGFGGRGGEGKGGRNGNMRKGNASPNYQTIPSNKQRWM